MRSELYRVATIRSSWVSILVFGVVGLLLGAVNSDAWALLVGMGAYGLSAMIVSQHYQHRTAVLLYLAKPRRVVVLVGQVVTAVIVTVGVVAVSGLTVALNGDPNRYGNLLATLPVVAVFGAATAAIVRRSTWLFLGAACWFVFVEGLVGRLRAPLPFSTFLGAGAGDPRSLVIAGGWTVMAVVVAMVAVGRDHTGN
ncbi:hypothetical protein I0C86_01130 [Plantactinospora sp. S1510]|uniref:ABC transporter permease n=1 Tax=Plantactinospora alkalitolerans TaxID=2789879 RepID=A0ABS0GND9_9ACTN|nr:hypothetical protein [Plantactinospora alkalitolerans]MBF9127606.1 hypothetical protein [Plantactinospora alkalitolerans]